MSSSVDAILEAAAVPPDQFGDSMSDPVLQGPRRKRRCLRSIASVPCEGPPLCAAIVADLRAAAENTLIEFVKRHNVFAQDPVADELRWMIACLVVLRWRLVLPPDRDPGGSLFFQLAAHHRKRLPWSYVEYSIYSRSAMAPVALRGDPLERRGVGLARVVAACTATVACRS